VKNSARTSRVAVSADGKGLVSQAIRKLPAWMLRPAIEAGPQHRSTTRLRTVGNHTLNIAAAADQLACAVITAIPEGRISTKITHAVAKLQCRILRAACASRDSRDYRAEQAVGHPAYDLHRIHRLL